MIVVRGAILGKKIETNEFFIVENYRGIEKDYIPEWMKCKKENDLIISCFQMRVVKPLSKKN
ncbi:hypothetical protein bcgnr5387_14970 [Bacillus luti]